MDGETNWLEIKKEYLRRTVDGEKVVLTQLAKKHGVKPTTLRSRKNRERWDDFLDNVATTIETQRNTVATKGDEKADENQREGSKASDKADTNSKDMERVRKSISKLGNKNAIGNKGGKGAPKGNKYRETHGFYSKHLPAETMELFEDIEELDQLDLLWDSIKLKYAAIIRAQSIMFVEDINDTTEHLKKHKIIKGMSFTEEKEWEIQFAWDKYATFLNAQSRAMSELRGLIKQYNEQLDRGAATYEQELRVKKLQVEIDHMTDDGDADEKSEAINNFIKATTMSEAEVAKLFEGEKDD